MLAGSVKIPHISSNNTSIYAQYTIEVSNRNELQQQLQALSIPTAIHYPIAMHQQTALSHLGYKAGDFPNSELAAKRVISLPMHPYLQESDQLQIVLAVKHALKLAMDEEFHPVAEVS